MNSNADLIFHYFTTLSENQIWQIRQLDSLYSDWNAKINVISRKDIGNLYEHHVLHSLSIARAIQFSAGTKILDIGTGGGFPGVPLAILFPECSFKLIDSTGKKLKVVRAVAEAIGLKNVQTEHLRGEEEKGKYDFVVSRAVMPFPELVRTIRKNISSHQNNPMPNGLFCLKGGDLTEELLPFKGKAKVTLLSDDFQEEWFKEDKKLIYLPIQGKAKK
ncbi:MAG: 16S rRNA (guanine(527)-N(7))-methyltransferase RsmG [Prevotella sp.]|jgi:16S rRNA (guanine527-N7)-methyltransferase|nr:MULTISPECIES: 16S rRNA (guanine(527)-N(7))-methyltransferase RsmG [unclassified Prevotella]MCH3993333.1 16S rRNA (guanine(527)-N(7))-methyltransferase RsmG [Prevotella sp.]MCH4017818.1 16S rRNA (guanine(527)-N(7))-methyltransferase RsmG [Prevotella sp.]MCH4100991.1 16S rRNA (guanine(527)-N(7))-methyltransferase RsmG [Prevotella sp.]MCH4186849.1 16S rRNA (guanine(527)-N(7))-methyltransferase RsmG [Prevotella sp.]MCH4216287.1 16S rRNA (guanine(527)-N(7))-methyltransferase RsmG [Prevotella sp.